VAIAVRVPELLAVFFLEFVAVFIFRPLQSGVLPGGERLLSPASGHNSPVVLVNTC
jgi:hypothetical protein